MAPTHPLRFEQNVSSNLSKCPIPVANHVVLRGGLHNLVSEIHGTFDGNVNYGLGKYTEDNVSEVICCHGNQHSPIHLSDFVIGCLKPDPMWTAVSFVQPSVHTGYLCVPG